MSATTIITKNGSGAPAAGDLVQGELAVDLTNQTLYSKDSSGNVFKVGDTGGGSSGTFTDLVATDSFTSPGIDDNATSTAITIDANENVGIGTDAPASYTVAPELVVDAGVAGGITILGSGDLGSYGGVFFGDGAGADAYKGFIQYNHNNGGSVDQMIIGAGNVEAMRIDSTGNVGINASNPSEKLHVGGNALVGGEVESVASGATAGFKWGQDTATNYWKWAEFNNGSASLQNNSTSSAGSVMTIDTSGNVGIGTTAPINTNNYGGLTLNGASGGALSFTDDDVLVGNLLSSGGDMYFGTGGDTVFRNGGYTGSDEAMRIDTSGNVGIGTAAPSTLTVHNNISVGDGTGVTQISMNRNSANYLAALDPAGYLVFRTGGSNERMRIDATGTTTVTGGFEAAQPGAGANAFAAGPNAGGSTQGASAVAVGNLAGSSSQGNDSVAVGNRAGRTTQGSYAVAVGRDAGTTSQGSESVAVGRLAASLSQGNQSVSVGMYAGYNTQGSFAVAIGRESGGANQGDSTVAVGNSAGNSGQSVNAVAIGKAAGETSQGTSSIAIGNSAGVTNQGANGIIISSRGSVQNVTNPNHILLKSGASSYMYYDGSATWTFAGGDVTVPNDSLLVGRTSLSAAATDHGWQVYNTGIVYQYADAATSTDVHRWYNGAGSLVASINARGEGFFLGGATYSGPLKADEIIQDGAPVVDSLQIIRAFMKLRAATADPDSTVEELREKLKTAVDDIIDQFQDQIDNMPTPLED